LSEKQWRICGDFRAVNDNLRKSFYNTPRPIDLLEKMKGNKVFSLIDISRAFNQLPLSEQSKKYTTISTSSGLYSFQYLPFGIHSASFYFQRQIEILLSHLPFVTCYQDDICISSTDREIHKLHLEEVLSILASAGLVIALQKCRFFQSQITYLGYVFDGETIRPSQKNIDVILSWKRPKNVSTVRSILGCSNFYRHLIKNYADRTQHIRALTKKNARFHWSDECEKEFIDIQQSLTTSPCLTVFDPNLDLHLRVDSSLTQVGAILAHKIGNKFYPISYFSHTLPDSVKKLHINEIEAYGLIRALTYFDKYLDSGKQFTVHSDNHCVCWLLSNRSTNSKLIRWSMILLNYDCKLQYTSAQCLQDADCLSRSSFQPQKAIQVNFT
ncbi:MAG TPA: reverse transcriptase family protein, partial [Aquella sp.]|nr:reverse transcriptase family protein [Aquella sp.]